ncbi:VCBS domain-containing protein [Paraglaciecola aquimarina]|uniref:VCBS domain-containing protein n=1 Tax=Paraglaciecola aquimarina TaxID=1235557 RepID=A0ABU3SRH1_9ALTE|nr:VCBS domain-containing protein [Paraglaciecola aquimarina]MDU0352596.1 VCBS domain-containing protein [Paraglaciecola aquimarina]
MMKKQFLALSIITALTACGGDDDTPTIAATSAEISGDFSGIATKAVNPTGTLNVSDANPYESLVYPATSTGQFGTFFINAAGEWEYTLDKSNEQVIALVSSDMDSLVESPFEVTTADGTSTSVDISIDGIDVPATFSGALTFSVFYDDGSASAKVSVSDANPAEALFASDQTPTAMYGVVTFDSEEGEWTYDLDESIAEVKALNYVEDTETPPTLEDSFIIKSLDGTEATVAMTIKGSQLVPAVIEGLPIDDEGESTAMVNINSPDVTGELTIIDPNFDEQRFQVQDATTTSYGAFSIDEMGAWSYTVDSTNADIIALKGDGTAPTPLSELIKVMAVDGTAVDIPITINGLVGGNLAAQIGGEKDGKWVIDIADKTSLQGKATFLARYPESSAKDVKLVFSGRVWKGAELHRTYLAMTVRASGELRLNNETGNGKFHTLTDTVEKGKPFAVELTWDGSAGLPAKLSLSIDGTPITAPDMTFNSDNTFTSMTVGAGLQNQGPGFFDVQTKGGDTFEIDDFTLYSDVAGTEANKVFEETFESADDNDILEGKALNVDYLSNKSSNPVALSVPLTKGE